MIFSLAGSASVASARLVGDVPADLGRRSAGHRYGGVGRASRPGCIEVSRRPRQGHALAGIIDGAVDGVPTHVTVEGSFAVAANDDAAADASTDAESPFYRLGRGECCKRLCRDAPVNGAQASHVAPGFEVEARLVVARTALDSATETGCEADRGCSRWRRRRRRLGHTSAGPAFSGGVPARWPRPRLGIVTRKTVLIWCTTRGGGRVEDGRERHGDATGRPGSTGRANVRSRALPQVRGCFIRLTTIDGRRSGIIERSLAGQVVAQA